MTRGGLSSAAIVSVAAMPFICGIRMSIRTTSGLCSRTAATAA